MSSEPLIGRFSIGELIRKGVITAHKDGNYGSFYPRITDFGDEGVPLLTAKVIHNGRIDFDAAQKLSEEKANSLPFGFIEPGDILLSHNATVGRVAIVPSFNDRALVGTSLTYFRVDQLRLLPRYLAAFFESNDFQNQLSAVMGLSTRNQVPITAQRQLTIEIPSLQIQENISQIIGAIDDRITLLRESNSTLEAITQALFKSWFVDFDPVHAKQEGRAPEGMDEATAALFPDSFEESELGLVPMGWKVDNVYKISTVIYGAPFASSKFNTNQLGKPLIRIRDLKDEAPGIYTDEIHPKGYLVQPGDIVVGMDGEFRAYLWGGQPAWLNQRVCVFAPKTGISSTFVRLSITSLLAAVEASETATTVIHLGKNDINRFKVRVPDTKILEAFGNCVNPLYEKIVESKLMVATLTSLRDTLLPRLISGQMRLPEVETHTEESH